MTIAAAAICTVETTLGGRKHAVLCMSDRMLTADDVEFEQGNHTKIGRLEPARAVCLFAGDVATNTSVLTSSQREVHSGGMKNIGEIAALMARNLASFKNAKAEANHLSSFGLNMESYLSRQAELSPELVVDLANRIRSEYLGVDMIVAGMDERGAALYSLYAPNALGEEAFQETNHEGSGFYAIGSGARQFQAALMSSGYDTTWRLHDALLLMYSAKKRAETLSRCWSFDGHLHRVRRDVWATFASSDGGA